MDRQPGALGSLPYWSRFREFFQDSVGADRRRRSARPGVERLETKSLLSAGAATSVAHQAAGVHAPAVEAASAQNEFPYSGLGTPRHVTLSQVPTNPGGPPVYPPQPTGYRGVAIVRGVLSLYLDFEVGDLVFPFAMSQYKVLKNGKIQKRGEFGVYKGLKNNGTDFTVYTGTQVVDWFPGTVVKVVKNWTPASGDPNGNQVVVRTVEPNGIVFYVAYTHLLGGKYLTLKVGDVLPASDFVVVGRAGHTGIPADGTTTFSITAWTPMFGGKYLGPTFTVGVSPVTIGTPPNFVDLDPNPDGSTDDPDNDADDPGGFGETPPTSP